MLFAFILFYAVTLLYLCTVERFRYYATIIGLQGWLLFFIALYSNDMSLSLENILLYAETSIVKGVVVPFMLFHIIKKTHVNHVHRNAMPPSVTVCMALLSLAASAIIASNLTEGDQLFRMTFGLAIFGVLVGLILITTHRRIFSHLVGFLALENSMFLLSMTMGTNLPFMVDIAVAFDLLIGVLMLGFVIGKVSERTGTLNSDKLSNLKD